MSKGPSRAGDGASSPGDDGYMDMKRSARRELYLSLYGPDEAEGGSVGDNSEVYYGLPTIRPDAPPSGDEPVADWSGTMVPLGEWGAQGGDAPGSAGAAASGESGANGPVEEEEEGELSLVEDGPEVRRALLEKRSNDKTRAERERAKRRRAAASEARKRSSPARGQTRAPQSYHKSWLGVSTLDERLVLAGVYFKGSSQDEFYDKLDAWWDGLSDTEAGGVRATVLAELRARRSRLLGWWDGLARRERKRAVAIAGLRSARGIDEWWSAMALFEQELVQKQIVGASTG